MPGWKRSLETTTALSMLLGFAALSMLEPVSGAFLLLATLLLLPGAILSRQPNSLAYARTWNLATLLFMAVSLMAVRWKGSDPVQATAHLCVFLQVHKAFNYREARDYFQIWTLALMMLLLVPMSLQTPSAGFGVLLLGFLALSVWHLGALGWRADASVPAPPPSDAETRAGRQATAPRIDLDAGGGTASALGVAWRRLLPAGLTVTLLLFLCLPRPSLAPTWRRSESGGDARSRQSLLVGFSRGIDLGQLSALRLDPTEVLRLSGGTVVRHGAARLRAATLDWFDGTRWEHTTHFGGNVRLTRHPNPPEFRLTDDPHGTDSTAMPQRVRVDTLDFHHRGVLTLPGTVGVGGLGGDLWMNDDGTLVTWPGSPRQYILFVRPESSSVDSTASPSFGREGGNSERHLQIPDTLDRSWLETIARSMTAEAQTEQEKARRIETALKRRGQYSLDAKRSLAGDDSTVIRRFLDAPRPEGHCELFATAMVLLCRTAGLPSRVATGFLGGEMDERTGERVFRHQDAHAWVEVWIPERGWMTFDPTPPMPLVNFSDRLPFLQMRAWMGGIVAGWTRLVQDYGEPQQRNALRWMAKRFDAWFPNVVPVASAPHPLSRLREGMSDPVVRRTAFGLLALNLVAYVLWRCRRRWLGTWLAARPDPKSKSASSSSIWLSPREALLEAVGGGEARLPPSGITLGEHLMDLARRNGLDWAVLRPAHAYYEKRRYRDRRWTHEDTRRFEGLLARVRAGDAHRHPPPPAE